MNQIDALRFPFLGEREDGDPFEYLLLSVSQGSANIAVFNWMVNPIKLDLKEKVNLFIPNLLTPVYQLRNHASGVVNSVKNEEGSYYYEILLEKEIPFSANSSQELAQSLSYESSLLVMLIRLVKDTLILKQGIIVYLKHLAPYFSRVVDYSHKDYAILKKFFFDDLENKVKANEKELTLLYDSLKLLKDPKEIPITINLEYLRENIESEMSLDLFLMAFAKFESREQLIELFKDSSYQDKLKLKYYHLNYLIAIKNLEKRLYSNYNQIVLIYLKFI